MIDAGAPRHLGPARARMLALLQDAGQAMTSTEVAERLAMHPNSARFHLEKLADDGIVDRERESRSAPGRPRLLYRVADAAPPAHRSYRLLSEILTHALIGQHPEPARAATEAGRAWGTTLAPPPSPQRLGDPAEAIDALVASMDLVGFDSHVVAEHESLRVEVSHCPFLEVAAQGHEVVCSVHLGLMRGVLEQVGGVVDVASLEPWVEPSRCVAHLSTGGRPSAASSASPELEE